MISNVIKKLCTLSLIVFTAHAEALVVLQQLTAPVSVEYDSNPLLLTSNKQSVWRYTTVPSYTIAAVENNNRWYGNVGIRIQRSSNKNISIDREDPIITLGWDRQGERDELKLLANYSQNSTRNTQLTTTGLINTDVTETRKLVSADWSRLLTQKLNLAVGGEIVVTSFDSAAFVGFTTKTIDSTLSYQVTEKLTTFSNISFVRFTNDVQNNIGLQASQSVQNSQNYLAGFTYLVNPQLDFTVALGINHTSSVGSANIGEASINYQAERHLIKGELARNVAAAGLGQFQQSDILNLAYTYDFGDKSALGSSFSLQKNKSLNPNDIIVVGGFYSRELSNSWSMRANLDYRRLKDTTQSVSGEVAGLTFIYTTPEF